MSLNLCRKCKKEVTKEMLLNCMVCHSDLHYLCGGVSEINFGKLGRKKLEWKCLDCKAKIAAEKDTPKNPNAIPEKDDAGEQMKKYFNENVEQLEEKLQTQKDEVIAALTSKVAELEKKLTEKDERILDLEERMDMIENRSRINNIEIRNFPETKNENVVEIVKMIGKTMGMPDLKDDDVQVAHRVSGAHRENGKRDNRPIVAHLKSRYLRNIFLQKYKDYKKQTRTQLTANNIHPNLPNVNIYIYEHITVQRKILLNAVRKYATDKNIKFVWVKDAMILVKKDENDHRITKIGTQREFERFRNSY